MKYRLKKFGFALWILSAFWLFVVQTPAALATGLTDKQLYDLTNNTNWVGDCGVSALDPKDNTIGADDEKNDQKGIDDDIGASVFTDGQGYKSDQLNGTYSYAELSPGGVSSSAVTQETATALGKLPYKQKVAITYDNKTVVAEKLDIGKGGGDVKGKKRGIDLIYDKTAKALGVDSSSTWTDVVHVKAVADNTPLGPVDDPASLTGANLSSDDDQTTSCCTGGSSEATMLAGKDNPQKIWNYFIGKGLTDKQAAGILGNLQQESGFNPLAIQNGGQSKNPSDAGGGGWGLIQYTPGSKVTGLAATAGVKGPIYEMSTQLDLIWEHMHNHPIVTKPFDLNHFKAITSETEAAAYFGSQIEGFGIEGARIGYSTQLLHKYGGKGGGSTSDTSSDAPIPDTSDDSGASACGGGSASNSSSPDCQGATGNAKILCEAKKYDAVDYVWGGGHGGGSAYHKACTDIKGNSTTCGLDCSGLVGVAIYDAFGNNQSWTTITIVSDKTNWKAVSLGDVQPGDVLEPHTEHVEIVDHITNNVVYTFGAHSATYPQEKQVGATQYSNAKNASYKFFRYIGKGATE